MRHIATHRRKRNQDTSREAVLDASVAIEIGMIAITLLNRQTKDCLRNVRVSFQDMTLNSLVHRHISLTLLYFNQRCA